MQQKKLSLLAKDKKSIHAIIFSSNTDLDPKGILIVCHGFGEHIMMYKEFAQYLTDNNYACVIYDQRGHGEMDNISDRSKKFGIIPNYKSFLDDIDVISNTIMSLHPGVPLILYGHSMGGNIAVNYLLNKDQHRFKCAILETPWLRLYRPFPDFVVTVARILAKLSPKLAITNKLNVNDITRDKQRKNEIKDDELYHNRISFQMFVDITDAGEKAMKNATNLTIPTLLICAGEDKIVCAKAIKEFNDETNSNVSLKRYEDAYHAVHSDINKKTYFEDITKFLDSELYSSS